MKQINSQQGAAMLFFIMFFVVTASALTFMLSRSASSDMFLVSSLVSAKQAYLTAESGLEDVVSRTMNGDPVSATTTLNSVVGVATTSVTYNSATDIYTIRSIAKVGRANKIDLVELSAGAGTTFNYGLQAGNGGFELVNSASITGNAFANGEIEGQGSSMIYGDVISAGPSGIISEITATGSAWANTLDKSDIDGSVWVNTLNDSLVGGDAYYNVVGVPSTVTGTRYTPYTYTAIDPIPLPIPDSEISGWETTIQNTGTIIPATSCSGGEYLINSNTTLGNVKIECNLRVRKQGASTVLTLTGPIWVTGNITLEQGPTLQISSTLGRRSVQVIADNPSNRLTSSKFNIGNSTQFVGSGHASSFIMLVSQNNAAEMGDSDEAIDINQSSNGDLILYAGHGRVDINNQIYLKSVTGYEIEIGNNSDITYDTGLSSVLFTGGPGGGYVISDWYQE